MTRFATLSSILLGLFFNVFVINSSNAQTKTIEPGSVIINMGVTPQTYANGLRPYGLVYELLTNQKVPVLWSINQSITNGNNKGKDGIDFTVDGINFRGGPFVIERRYATIPAVQAAIASFAATGVVVHTTSASVSIPVYKELTSAPIWALDTDNGSIARGYLNRAGIPANASIFISPQNLGACNDLYVMPHADPVWSSHSNLYTWNDVHDGWIWSACHAVSALENTINPNNTTQQMNFLSTRDANKITPLPWPSNSLVLWGNHNDGILPFTYNDNEHASPYMQFMANLDAATTNGSEQIYLPIVGQGWRSSTTVAVSKASAQIPSLSPGPAAVVAYGRGLGDPNRGKVMYQGGHNHDRGNNTHSVAAMRAFLNFSFDSPTEKKPTVTNNITLPEFIYSGESTSLDISASSPAGATISSTQWTSTCGGTFSNPNSATTTFTAPTLAPNIPEQNCLITVTVTDSCGRVNFQTTSVPIRGVPVANDDLYFTYNNTPILLTPLANDTAPNNDLDPASLTNITPLNPTGGTFVINSNGTINFTPTAGFTGNVTLEYEICDSTSPIPLCDTATITVTVFGNPCEENEITASVTRYGSSIVSSSNWDNVNNALGAPDNLGSRSRSGGQMIINLGGPAFIGSEIRFRIYRDNTGVPVAGTIDKSTTTTFPQNPVNVATNATLAAPDIVTLTVTQPGIQYVRLTGVDRFAIESVTYSQRQCLGIPIATDDTKLYTPGTPVTVDVLSNDILYQGTALNPATVSIVGGTDTNSSGFNNQKVVAGEGTWTVNETTGEITFSPEVGFTGVPTPIQYTVRDNNNLTSTTANVILETTPVAVNDTDTYIIGLPKDVHILDNDLPGSFALVPSTISIVGGDDTNSTGFNNQRVVAGQGTWTVDEVIGIIRFTPEAGFTGNPTPISYTVQNVNGQETNEATVTLTGVFQTVENEDLVPDINATFINVEVTGNLSTNDFTGVGTDYDISSTLVSSPGGSSFTLNINDDGTYTFTGDLPGVYEYLIEVCGQDQTSPCPTEFLTIIVIDPDAENVPPFAHTDLAITLQGQPVTLNTLSNDAAGTPGANLVPSTVSIVAGTAPDAGTVGTLSVNSATGEITFTPVANFTGIVEYRYEVCDDQSPPNCATALQRITVYPDGTLNALLASDDFAFTVGTEPATGNALLNDTSLDGGTLTATVQSTLIAGVGTLELSADGSFEFIGEPGFTGPVNFPYEVCDDATPQQCANATIYILVRDLNMSLSLTIGPCWRMLSSPFQGMTYNDLLGHIWTQGVQGSDFPNGEPNIFIWSNDQPDIDGAGWRLPDDMNDIIPPGTGLLVSVFTDDEFGVPGSWDKEFTYRGLEHETGAAPVMNKNPGGWTLVGNPFGTTVDFNQLNKSSLTDVAYVYDRSLAGGGGWRATDGTFGELPDGLIAPFQGFFVQTDSDPEFASLSLLNFPREAKTTGGQFYGKEKEKENYVRLELMGESLYSSSWITFSERGEFTRIKGDAYKLEPFTEEFVLLGTRKQDEIFDIGHFPAIDEQLQIPLAIETTTPGRYTLTVSDLELPMNKNLVLIDTERSEIIPLTKDMRYEFRVNQASKIGNPITENFLSCSSTGLDLANAFYPQKVEGVQTHRFIIREAGGLDDHFELPNNISLNQNFPNPFNPTTQITYNLPAQADVRLDIYDMTGRLVVTLVDGSVHAGSHTVTFDAANLSSGIYIYRLQVGGAVISRKLTLLK